MNRVNLLPFQRQMIEFYRNDIISNCPRCNGKSSLDCICINNFNRIAEYIYANIPRSCWDTRKYSAKGENKKVFDFIKKCCKKVEVMKEKGMNLVILGPVRSPKSLYSSCILNSCLINGYSCYFITFKDLIIRSQESYKDNVLKKNLDEIYRSDFLVIHNLEEIDYSLYYSSRIENMLFGRILDFSPVIVTSTIMVKRFQEVFGDKLDIGSKTKLLCVVEERGKNSWNNF